jgi:hypothetical protein
MVGVFEEENRIPIHAHLGFPSIYRYGHSSDTGGYELSGVAGETLICSSGTVHEIHS